VHVFKSLVGWSISLGEGVTELTAGDRLMIRVFLADDHPLLRIGLRLSFERERDVRLVGEAGDGFSAVERVQNDPPDVLLIDVDMPGISGIGAIRVLRKALPEMKILVLSTYNDEKYIRDAMEAGADGYILKCIEIDELVRIIKSFCAERPVVSPYLVNLTLRTQGGKEPGREPDTPFLSIREREVLRFIVAGRGNKEIASKLHISTETVKSHTKKIYQKLKVKNRVQAARAAIGTKLLH
jgi:DNA-binding NarL/FixJ family response regulator